LAPYHRRSCNRGHAGRIIASCPHSRRFEIVSSANQPPSMAAERFRQFSDDRPEHINVSARVAPQDRKNGGRPVSRVCDRSFERRLSLDTARTKTGEVRHEISFGQRRDCCRGRDDGTGVSAAYGPRSIRGNRYRPGGDSPWRARPLLSTLQSAGRVSWFTWRGGSGAEFDYMGTAATASGKCDIPCGRPAITVIGADRRQR
jgi:hypothetical protein